MWKNQCWGNEMWKLLNLPLAGFENGQGPLAELCEKPWKGIKSKKMGSPEPTDSEACLPTSYFCLLRSFLDLRFSEP